MAKEGKKANQNKVLDLSELYSDMVPVDRLVQLNENHSPYWNARVNKAAAQMEKDIAENEDLIEARENPHRPEHY